MLGLFDRPADPGALALLRKEWMPIPDGVWQSALESLKDARLLLDSDPGKAVDCHPLIREHFGSEMRTAALERFQRGHELLYEYCSKQAPHRPDTLVELTPLFYAVYHGCQAGKHQEVLEVLHRDRILRGDEFYLVNRLGMFGTNLSLLANFFRSPWRDPVSTLSPADHTWVINDAAFTLRALGRLSDAVTPMRAAAEAAALREYWKSAATRFCNLSELLLTLGSIPQAISAARDSLCYADQSGCVSRRMISRATLADALHQLGDCAAAAPLFLEAERLQAGIRPCTPILDSLRGYQYRDFLLAQGQSAEVLVRSHQTLRIAERRNRLLDIGLEHLTFALGGEHGHIDLAVDYLRSAGTLHHLPRGLLARGTQADLDEVRTLAERCGMRLHLTDYHLAQARLYLRDARKEDARPHVVAAAKLIAETGYHRRDPELRALQEQLGDSFAAAAPQ